MTLPVVFRRKVGQDLAAGFGYYEEQSTGLGESLFAFEAKCAERFTLSIRHLLSRRVQAGRGACSVAHGA